MPKKKIINDTLEHGPQAFRRTNLNSKLCLAIGTILSGSTGHFAHADTPADTADDSGIAEITVTAQRRSQNMQDVPITIQALTGETLTQLNVSTFDDYIKYLPNVTQQSNGPGQSAITMRGLSVGVGSTALTSANSIIPNVAVYLDEQSAALPSRNLDVYAADLERIEVLEGPQGTLFGSGAEAGVLRYITNKPKLDTTEAKVDAGYSYTAGGDPNSNVTAVINLPLIEDTLAVRAVVYDDHRGGYIYNVPSTFNRMSTDAGIIGSNGGVVPINSEVINNSNVLSGSPQNSLSYQGFRLSALYKFNSDWNALLVQSYQDMDAQGVFYEQPYGSDGQTLAHDQVTVFNPSYDKDKFENTALTVNGKIGDLKLVYAGSYLVRDVEQQQDYTNYSRSVYSAYYQCVGLSLSSKSGNPNATCFSPSAITTDIEKNTHLSQELRLSTPDDWRIRAIAGLYYEQYNIYHDNATANKSVPTCSPSMNVDCFLNIGSPPGETTNEDGTRNDNVSFFVDFQRKIEQKAAFTSVDIDIVPKVLTLTVGTRFYDFNESIVGGDVLSYGCFQYTPTNYFGQCTPEAGTNLNAQADNHSKYTGFRSRGNLSWKVTDDAMLYYTWSQGYRPGGFNRGSGEYLPDSAGVPQFLRPETYAPDTLINNELGFKTLWLNRRFQADGTIYQENWNNTQVQLFDPGVLGPTVYTTNGPNYRVRGVELQLSARLGYGITVTGSSAWNSGEQVNSPSLINNNPQSAGFGKPITTIANVYGTVGSPLAASPPFQMNLRIRDDFPLGSYRAFWQLAGFHTAHQYSSASTLQQFDQEGYTTYDASAGVAKDAWTVTFFGQNLTNVNASTFTTDSLSIRTEMPTRPRIAGLTFSYKF